MLLHSTLLKQGEQQCSQMQEGLEIIDPYLDSIQLLVFLTLVQNLHRFGQLST